MTKTELLELLKDEEVKSALSEIISVSACKVEVVVKTEEELREGVLSPNASTTSRLYFQQRTVQEQSEQLA
jgi:hypothetical protein